MYKLTQVIRYTVQSKFFIFAVLERWLIHGVITGCSFYYSIKLLLVHNASATNTAIIMQHVYLAHRLEHEQGSSWAEAVHQASTCSEETETGTSSCLVHLPSGYTSPPALSAANHKRQTDNADGK